MKAIFVAILLFMWMPFVLMKPHMGVLLWDWISHMVPHVEAGGFARSFPFLDFVALLTVAGLVLGKDKHEFPVHAIAILMLVYLLWTLITTGVAIDPDNATEKLVKLVKVVLFAVITMAVMQSPGRLKAFVGVMALSLLFAGITGGLFTIATGGGARVQGAGGMMADNNQLATAFGMLVPIIFYYIQHPPLPILRWPAIGAFALTCAAVLGTQSRGGFVTLAAVLFALLMKSRRRVLILVLMVPAAFVAYEFMPDRWKARMETTQSATDDGSFRGRLVMWKFATNLVEDYPIEGGGFDVFYVPKAREIYTPYGETPRAVHSIYFEVLGEHGYVGLILFMTMIFTAWYTGGTNYSRFKRRPETLWVADLSNSLRIGIMGYCVGGLTLNLATFDLLYHYLAVMVLCSYVGQRLLAQSPQQPADLAVENSNQPIDREKQKAAPKAKWSPYN